MKVWLDVKTINITEHECEVVVAEVNVNANELRAVPAHVISGSGVVLQPDQKIYRFKVNQLGILYRKVGDGYRIYTEREIAERASFRRYLRIIEEIRRRRVIELTRYILFTAYVIDSPDVYYNASPTLLDLPPSYYEDPVTPVWKVLLLF